METDTTNRVVMTIVIVSILIAAFGVLASKI